MNQMDSAKVAMVGAGGIAGSAILEQINVLVAICVGVATLVYIVVKTYYLVKNRGRDAK